MMRITERLDTLLLSMVAVCCVSMPSLAKESASPEAGRHHLDSGGMAGLGMTVATKIGAHFGGVLGDLGTSPTGELELGWIVPLPKPVQRAFELSLSAAYAQPLGSGTVKADPRLPGDGITTYDLIQEQAMLSLGVRYRFPLSGSLRPYLALGARMWMVRTTQTGIVGGALFPDEHVEESNEFGVHSALGCDWLLGPGALVFELQLNHGVQERRIRLDAQVGGLATLMGYRLFL